MARNGSADGSIIIDTELDTTGLERGSAEIEKRVGSLCSAVNRLGQSLQKSAAGYSSTLGEILSQTYTNDVEGLAQKLKALGTAKIPTEPYAQLCTELEKTEKKFNALIDRQEKLDYLGVSHDSTQWKSLQYDIEKCGDAFRELEATKAQMESSGTAFTLGSQTVEYQRLRANLIQLRTAMVMNEPAANSLGGTYATLGERLRAAGRAALTTAKNIAVTGFKAAANGVKRLGREMAGYVRNARAAATQTNFLKRSLMSVKNLLLSQIGFRAISAIFSGVREGMQQLALFDSKFNDTMSRIKNSATQLTGNLTAAFGNLITVVEPVLTKIINLLSSAISHLNQFFALLNGKTTYTAAKKGTAKYAEATEEAAAAQKALNAELYSFDELNRQSKPVDSNTSSAVETPEIQYEEIPIDLPESVQDWINRLKEAWNSGEWYSFGQTAAEGLNSAVKRIDAWINGTLRPKGIEWATKTAQILNGFFDGVDWAAMGKTVADGFNAVVDTVVTFFDTLSFGSIVQAVENFLASALQNINPAALIATFFLPSLITAVKGLIAAHPVASLVIGAIMALGPQLGETLKKMVDNIDLGAVGTALSDGLIWVLSRLSSAIESVNWQELTTAIFQELLNLITSIDYAAIVSSMFRLLGAAIGAVAGIIGSLVENLWNLLKSAWEGVKAYFGDYFEQYGGNIVAGLLAGIANALVNIGAWIVDNIFKPFIDGFCNAFGIHSPSTVMEEMGGYVVAGLFNGIKGNWDSISDFFSDAVSNLTRFLSDGWKNIATNAKTAWGDLKTNITTAFENTRSSLQNSATQIRDRICAAFNNARTSVLDTAGNMRSNLNSAFSGIVSNAQTAWGNLQTVTNNKFSNLRTNVLNAWQNLRTNLNNVKWNNVGHNLVAGLNNGVAGAWGGFMSNVSNMVNNLIRRIKNLFGIHSPSKVFAEIGEFLDLGLEQGMHDGERGLLSTAKEVATAVTEGITPDTPNVQMNVDSVVGSMQAIISSLGSLAVTFQTIAQALNSIGGFTLPNIAAGKVVPYQTKVAANAAPAGAEGGVEAYLLGILAELQSLARSMRNGDGKQTQPISISIGGREVFQVVVDENNRAVRTTGKSPLKV